MIVLPAIPAIVAALTPLVKAAAVAAGIGGLIGAGTGAVSCGISGVREHGEINQEVATNAGQCAAEGTMFGVVTAPAGLLLAPAIASTLVVVDDIAMPLMQVADKVARPVVGTVDDVVRPAVNAVDDAARPMLNKAGKAAGSVGHAIASPFNKALNSFRARIYKRLPVTTVGADDGWVYVMEDTATGIKKIGHTSNPEQRLKSIQNGVGHKNVRYSCIIHSSDKKGLESILKDQFKSHNITHSTPHAGMTEWFVLSAAQVAAACSH